MNRRISSVAAWAAASVMVLAVAIAEEAGGPSDVAKIRSRTVKLREDYRKAEMSIEQREKIIAEAIELSPDAARAIHKLALRDGETALQNYGRAFYSAIDDAERKDVENVFAASEMLQKQRQWLIDLVRVTEPLKMYVAKLDEEEKAVAAAGGIDDLLSQPDLGGLAAKPVDDVNAAEAPSADPAKFEEYLVTLETGAVERWIKDKNLSELSADELHAIELTNKEREMKGLKPLVIDVKLCLAARDHSEDMKTVGFFAHESPVEGKKTFSDRARRFATTAHGENIARYNSAPAAVEGWMNSDGHRANILNDGYHRIGIGKSGDFYTQMFGN